MPSPIPVQFRMCWCTLGLPHLETWKTKGTTIEKLDVFGVYNSSLQHHINTMLTILVLFSMKPDQMDI
jgi:hypothetical protein